MSTRFAIIALAVAMLPVACVQPGGAPAGFNIPAKAKAMKVSMVRAYAECPGPTGPCALSALTCEVQDYACTPVPLSSYEFGPQGSCFAKAVLKAAVPCSTGGFAGCLEVHLGVKCKDVLDSGGMPASTPGTWKLSVDGRVTVASGGDGIEAVAGDATLVDPPLGEFTLNFLPPSMGKLLLKSKNAFQDSSFAWSPSALPIEGTNIELHSLRIIDPDGNDFAVMGLGAPPQS
jgi:hypothetical protein